MPQLYFTDLAALRRPAIVDGVTHELPAETIAAVEATGLSDGMPFILDNCGGYDLDLNRFFRACPTMGVRSSNSLRAYARDLLVWMRFLSERRENKPIWQANREDVAVYHAARRRSAPVHRISAASWNRAVAALEKFYGWAVEEELIAASPFGSSTTWRRVRGGRFAPVRTVRAREPGARRGDLRFVGLDHFLSFRDVGLRGRQLDGCEDATWSGRHGERNALFAELLVTTGLRLEEAASLLIIELPLADRIRSAPRSFPFRLPASIAKGGRSREIRLPARLLHRLADYVAIERANALTNFRDFDSGSIVVADGPTRGAIGLADVTGQVRSVRLDLLSPTERRRLVTSSGEPMILWLNEAGRPMTSPAWAAVFRRASMRCRTLGIDLDVTPHALRHTFAVHMLSMLIREQIGAVLADGAPDEPGSAAYRRMIGDPLQKLQRLLGHAKKCRLNHRDGVDSLAGGIEEVQKPAQFIDVRAHLGGCAYDTRSRQTVAQRRAEGASKPWPRGVAQGDGDAFAALYWYLEAERAERPGHGGLGRRKACPPAAHDTSFVEASTAAPQRSAAASQHIQALSLLLRQQQ